MGVVGSDWGDDGVVGGGRWFVTGLSAVVVG